MEISYSDDEVAVRLGDHVEKVGWFFRRLGRVVYVPGFSKVNADLEFNGLAYVAIRMANGNIIATVVEPRTRRLKKSIRFRMRGGNDFLEIQPHERFNG